MRNFTLFGRGDCPICSGTEKGCRVSNTTGLIFCRDASASPTGYIHRGQDIWGFGLWQAVEDAEVFSQQANEERQRRRNEFLEREQQRREKQIAEQLSAVERDRGYRKILDRLSLSDADRQDLLNRGFTQEQIEKDGYRSVEPWQKVGRDLPSNLPGILGNGSFNVHTSGILCPVRNQDGLIVACQIRLHDGSDGRYRWLTSSTKRNPSGASPHLGGELPLGTFEPAQSLAGSIWLTEGTAIKPSLTCHKLGVPVLGAASGRFNASPQTAKAAIAYLTDKYKIKTLVFAVDAGDMLNKNGVPERWQQQFDFFQSLGYECRIGWWGQVTKQDSDIDELTDTSVINFISPDEFKALVEEYQKQSHPESHSKSHSESHSETKEKTNDWAWEQWLRSRKFTPDKRLNQEKFRFGAVPDSGVIVAAKSGLGTGKTEALIELINSSSKAAMVIGYRNNLLFQTINRAATVGVNIYHLRADDGHHLIADDTTSQAFCLDSIHHVDGYFEGRDIYLDETCSVLLHAANGGTLGDGQAKAIRILNRALEECNRVILLDGNLSDIHVNFIAKLAKNKQVIKLENQRLIPSHDIKFVEGVDVEGEVKKRDKSALIKGLCSDSSIPWIATDSKELSKTLDRILKDSGKIGFVLNAETAGEDWAKIFLENPDSFLLKFKPQYFIISPTAESGVSVTVNNYFTEKFTFLSGVLGTNSQHQIMFRLRDNSIPHYVFCPERSFIRDRSNPKTYATKAFQQALDDRMVLSALLASQSSDSPDSAMEVIGKALARSNDDWWEFSCKLGALDNFEMDNLRRCLTHALSSAGHDVEIIQWETDGETAKKIKTAREAVQMEYAQELFVAAKFDSVEEAKQKAKTNPRKEVQRRIEKTFLIDRLPGIEMSEQWSVDFIYEHYIKDRDFITRQQRFYLLSNFEISQKRHEVDWFYKATNEDFFSASMKKSSHLTVWALQQLNPLQFLEGEWHKDSPEVIEFVEKARQPEIADALRMQPGVPRVDGKEKIEFVTDVLAMLGLKRKSCGQRLVDGVRTRFYCVDQEALKSPDRLAVLKAVEHKFTLWMEEKSQVCWKEQPVEPVEAAVDVVPVETEGVEAIQAQPLEVTQPQAEIDQVAAVVDIPQVLEQVWGITREQAQRLGAAFHWIRGGIVRVMYAGLDYAKLTNGAYINLSELAPATYQP